MLAIDCAELLGWEHKLSAVAAPPTTSADPSGDATTADSLCSQPSN
jgi:hypothetical protein